MFRSLKRSHDMFVSDASQPIAEDELSLKQKIACKIRDEYSTVKDLAVPNSKNEQVPMKTKSSDSLEGIPPLVTGTHPYPSGPGVLLTPETQAMPTGVPQEVVQKTIADWKTKDQRGTGGHGVGDMLKGSTSTALATITPSQQLALAKQAVYAPKPRWHPPWKLMRVISGHVGWVRCIAVDPGNDFFATGSSDRVIKIWELATGKLRLSLTGHISAVRALAISPRQPYMFSAGEDKQVKCWDLEQNKVVRHYHGHLSAVHTMSLHPTIDVLVTGGRDSSARVWDMRTKACIHTLTGHTNTIADVKTQGANPQIITGSHDSTIRLWDLAAGKTLSVLTNHKKSVRSLTLHPSEFTFASASPDNIKQWKFPDGNFIQNMTGHSAIINCLTVNGDNVLVSGGDNGTMYFWDWRSGYNFQKFQTQVQPGSIDSEAGIFDLQFDMSGSRLITAEADKTIKIYKEDEMATEETNPIVWKAEISKKKRY